MRLHNALAILPVGLALASPQAKGAAPKATAPKASSSSGAGSGGFNALGIYLNGSVPANAEIFSSLIKSMGMDPNMGIAAMVCETWRPGGPQAAMAAIITAIFGTPIGKGPGEECRVDLSGGSGPYTANYTEDPSLPYHTIYAPKVKPKEKLPVIIWANGFCMSAGTMFANFHNEIASHGFMIIANGPIKGGVTGFTHYQDLIKSIDWVTTNPAAQKYGDLDLSKITVAGQSCGGEEAYAASKDPRVKLTVLFNSPVFSNSAKILKNPVAYFLGGPQDMAQRMGDMDYLQVPSGVAALKVSNPIGHIGSYYQKNGGKTGRAAVPFFKWQLKGDAASKAVFCGAGADSVVVKDGGKIESKNGMC